MEVDKLSKWAKVKKMGKYEMIYFGKKQERIIIFKSGEIAEF